jgi:beta-glucosidase
MPLRRWFSLLPLVLFCLALPAQSTQPAYQDTKAAPADRAHDLVGRMTLDEKTQQLEDWATPWRASFQVW